jgi:hypothetical protein
MALFVVDLKTKERFEIGLQGINGADFKGAFEGQNGEIFAYLATWQGVIKLQIYGEVDK